MKSLSALVICLALVGCQCVPKVETRVFTKTEYVVSIPPEKTMTLPPKVETPDADKSTQKDVAKYINSLEGKITELENKLIEIAKFFQDEKDRLAKKAAEQNKGIPPAK